MDRYSSHEKRSLEFSGGLPRHVSGADPSARALNDEHGFISGFVRGLQDGILALEKVLA